MCSSRLNTIIVMENTIGHKYRWHATTKQCMMLVELCLTDPQDVTTITVCKNTEFYSHSYVY